MIFSKLFKLLCAIAKHTRARERERSSMVTQAIWFFIFVMEIIQDITSKYFCHCKYTLSEFFSSSLFWKREVDCLFFFYIRIKNCKFALFFCVFSLISHVNTEPDLGDSRHRSNDEFGGCETCSLSSVPHMLSICNVFYFFFECKSVLITCNYCQSTCWRWSDSSNAMRCFSRWTDVDTSLLSWSNKISKIKSQPRFALVYCFCLIFPIIEFAVWTHESEEISFWAAAAQSWS